MARSLGTVYLVGAGPGAPGLMTLEGVRCLQRAEIVIYDYLASPRLLDHAPPDADRVLVGKHGGGSRVEQERITALLVEQALLGRTVVRLKGGDPFVFGRGAEEAEALAAAGIPFEIVPGVSSVTAAAAYAGIPLTHRDLASWFTVATGYEYPEKHERAVHWDALARSGGTLVLLMTTRQLRRNMSKLVAHGLAPETPVAVIRWATVAEQETVIGTAANIADLIEARRFQPPAVAVVGEVVRLRESLKWFERKPLFGRRIIVTRPRAQAPDFVERLAAAGADVLACPVIEVVPPASWQALDDAIGRVEEFDWLVFTSINGVDVFFERLRALGRDVRVLHRARLAAVGSQTARALELRGLLVDLVPEEFRAEGVAQSMREVGIDGARVLLARAEGARDILPAMLREAGARVEEVVSYRTVLPQTDAAELRELLRSGRIDLVTFTSSSTVRNFLALLGNEGGELLQRTAVGCIGPITADTARQAGLTIAIQPREYTVAAFSAAILEHFGVTAAKHEGPA